jgi:coenzyme F420-reducing hydrogenase beta subunit
MSLVTVIVETRKGKNIFQAVVDEGKCERNALLSENVHQK